MIYSAHLSIHSPTGQLLRAGSIYSTKMDHFVLNFSSAMWLLGVSNSDSPRGVVWIKTGNKNWKTQTFEVWKEDILIKYYFTKAG